MGALVSNMLSDHRMGARQEVTRSNRVAPTREMNTELGRLFRQVPIFVLLTATVDGNQRV